MTSQVRGYVFAFLAFTVFSMQDAVSTHLGANYSPYFISMIRYWAFAAFAVALATRRAGGLAVTAKTHRPWLQIVRGLLLAIQIATAIISFATVGLAHSQAIFAAGPLVIAALSVPVLGEQVGWRRWLAILAGMFGVLVILNPQGAEFDIQLLIPMGNVLLGAGYALTTRLVNQVDTAMTSFFYTGVVGAVVMTVVGPFFWTSTTPADTAWLALLCATGIASHFCLIQAYHFLDAVKVQPISYFQLVLASILGVLVFGEELKFNVIVGSLIVAAAGLFTIWREAVVRRRNRLEADEPGASVKGSNVG